MRLNHLYIQPKLIQELYLLYIQLRGGYWKCRCSFRIWRFMMTHNVERLNERCHGLNAFDEFYASLTGDMYYD